LCTLVPLPHHHCQCHLPRSTLRCLLVPTLTLARKRMHEPQLSCRSR
jgi:hypothetical protein